MAAQEQALILRDSEGSYYLIPPAVLAANRVPAEALPALAAALGEEVSGYIAYVNNPNNTPLMIQYGPVRNPFPLPYGPLPLPYPPVPPTPGPLAPSHFDPGLLQ